MAPQSSSGNRVWWILAALFRRWRAGGGGIIAAYASHRFSRGNLVVPSSGRAPRGLSARQGYPAEPSPFVVDTATAAGCRAHRHRTQREPSAHCNNNVVTVSGVSNTVVITGHCASVTVSGLNNVITVDATDTIDASGLNNQVTYHSGSPQVSKSGDGNVVQRG